MLVWGLFRCSETLCAVVVCVVAAVAVVVVARIAGGAVGSVGAAAIWASGVLKLAAETFDFSGVGGSAVRCDVPAPAVKPVTATVPCCSVAAPAVPAVPAGAVAAVGAVVVFVSVVPVARFQL